MKATSDSNGSVAANKRGVVYTFYSFKGGVGRSMALANTAALLSKWGQRVLVVDWDLEAPGIEKFFERWISGSRRSTPGLVDLIRAFDHSSPREWQTCLLKVNLPGHGSTIHILSAGQDDPGDPNGDYGKHVQEINWETLFGKGFGAYLERLRSEWTASYDFVLVDSRTGITDNGGICTIHLPDVLVCLFTTTEQSLQGVQDVMDRAKQAHASLPVDRRRLLVVPLPARDESRTEYKLAKEWRERFATELGRYYKDWVPKGTTAENVLDLLKIPYVAFWSFGERLPVLEEDVENPDKLAYFYQLVARLMLSQLDLQEVRKGDGAGAKKSAESIAEAQKRTEEAELARQRAQVEAAERVDEQRARDAEARERRYRTYYVTRLSASIAGFSARAYMALALAVISASGAVGGLLYPQANSFLRLSVFHASFALGLLGLTSIVAWQIARSFSRKVRQLKREQHLFESQVSPYDSPDFANLTLFVDRCETIIESGLFQRHSVPSITSSVDTTAVMNVEKIAIPEDSVSLPEMPVAVDDRFDVFLSWRHDAFTEAWLREFEPLFITWLSDLTGRPVTVFNFRSAQGGDLWEERISQALSRSTCLVAILTPAYFQSDATRREWDHFSRSRRHGILPIVLRGSIQSMPEYARRFQLADFTDFAFVGEGFRKTPAYIEFQTQIRRLAERAADILRDESPHQPQ